MLKILPELRRWAVSDSNFNSFVNNLVEVYTDKIEELGIRTNSDADYKEEPPEYQSSGLRDGFPDPNASGFKRHIKLIENGKELHFKFFFMFSLTNYKNFTAYGRVYCYVGEKTTTNGLRLNFKSSEKLFELAKEINPNAKELFCVKNSNEENNFQSTISTHVPLTEFLSEISKELNVKKYALALDLDKKIENSFEWLNP